MFKALNVDEIPTSDVRTVSSPEKFLPEYLIIENGDVLAKRKNMKLLTYPTFKELTYNFKFSMVLLYFPLTSYAQINEEEDIDKLYYKTHQDSIISIVETSIRLVLTTIEYVSN